jgi:hypothetical protein
MAEQGFKSRDNFQGASSANTGDKGWAASFAPSAWEHQRGVHDPLSRLD